MELPLCKLCGTRHRLGWCPATGQDDPSMHQPKKARDEKAQAQAEKAPHQDRGSVQAVLEGHRPKRGRPSQADRARTLTATKPWELEGISQRTWYRRQHG